MRELNPISHCNGITGIHDVIFMIPPLQKSPLHRYSLLGSYIRDRLDPHFFNTVSSFHFELHSSIGFKDGSLEKIANIYGHITIEFRIIMFTFGSFPLRFFTASFYSIHQECSNNDILYGRVVAEDPTIPRYSLSIKIFPINFYFRKI